MATNPTSLSLSDSLYAFHCEMFGASAGNADSNNMPIDGMKGEALIILQVMTGEVVMLCLFCWWEKPLVVALIPIVGDFCPLLRNGGVHDHCSKEAKHTNTIFNVVRQITYIHGRDRYYYR
jgi:hypothetical protein